MATAVSRRYETRERSHSREDDCGSEASTLKGVFRPNSSETIQAFGGMRYVKSSTRVGSQIFKSDHYDSDSDEASFECDGENEEIEVVQKPPSVTKVSRIDLSPEAQQKRKEAYNKWLNSVIVREKERKRSALERVLAEKEKQEELKEELKAKSEEKVDEWMRKKRVEAEKRIARLNEMQRNLNKNEKPKEFKKSINFQDWLKIKNDELAARKQTIEKKKPKETSKRRESISHEQWMRTSSSKAKPVPFSRGLESLKGSVTKLYINPEPWKFDE